MTETDLPLWASIMVSLLVLTGAFLTMVGCIGLARLKTFYLRIHAPTLGTSFGVLLVAAASILFFTVTGGRPAVHEILVAVFVVMTTPVTLMMLGRAALYRDRAEDNPAVPRKASAVGAMSTPRSAKDSSGDTPERSG